MRVFRVCMCVCVSCVKRVLVCVVCGLLFAVVWCGRVCEVCLCVLCV